MQKYTQLLDYLKKNFIPVIIIAVVVIVGGIVFYVNNQKSFSFGKSEPQGLTAQQVGEKAISFINKNILQGQATASLLEAAEESGLYKLKIKIQDQELNTYATKDGKLFFPQPIDLDANPQASADQQQTESPQETPKTDKPNVKLFIMSFCPYGNQAEELMVPVLNLLGSKAEIEPHYVIYSNYSGGGPNFCEDKDNKYCSMHGIQEVHQNVRELCVYKYQKDKYWNFLKEINKSCSSQNADTCWEAVASGLGIDTQKIKDCQTNESLTLLEKELSLTNQLGVKGSPQLFINGVEYKGGRSSEDYKNGICSAFSQQPEECKQALSSDSSASTGGCQ